MLVVADSTPLNILVRTSLITVLPELYGQVVIPPAVAAELSHGDTPPDVKSWLSSMPNWLVIRRPASVDPEIAPDRGEQEAICLALELRADLLLVDDKRARHAATRVGLAITGTLGVLEAGSRKGLLDLARAIERLRQTDFFITDELLDGVLERSRQRAAGNQT